MVKESDTMEYRVISADNHIIEPPGTFVDRVAPKFKDQAPRVVRGKDGGDGWSVDGSVPHTTISGATGLGAVNPGMQIRTLGRGLRWDEVVPGNYDGAAHVAAMHSDGIDASVVYPQVTFRAYIALKNRDLALACVQAFNDWLLDEFQAADSKRLIGLCVMPHLHDMTTICHELERVLNKGARGIFLPYTMDHPHYDPYYDPMWQLLSDAGAPASLHITFGGTRAPEPTPPPGIQSPWLFCSRIVSGYFSGIHPMTELIFTGLFDRFPKLKFIDAEVNMGWLPFWGAMMDQIYEQHGYWSDLPINALPHTYIGRNIFVTAQDDVEGFRQAHHSDLVARGGMFSIDYPHEVTLFPKTQEYLADLTIGLDANIKHGILAGNAMRVFNLN
jgi:predicted TIM-barrel fold metal-dependent hydrolase